jgi:hypothetical protein
MSKFYKFDFDKGVPVQGAAMKWRKGLKTIRAYSLQDAVEKFAMPVFREYGTSAKLNVVKAWSSPDKTTWTELALDAVTLAAFLVGAIKRTEEAK